MKITAPHVISCVLCPSRTWKLMTVPFTFHFLILALRTVGALDLSFLIRRRTFTKLLSLEL